MPPETPSRRYRILGVLGEGGFGRVYRARLEGPEGFSKEVAIKLMTIHDPSEQIIRRFRDEARILGLVRDRAIVSAEPPTRLAGHWAVVMEFVDGASVARLVGNQGLPASVAVEIAEEVARTLDNLWRHPGPDGRPLHLLHRDLKPGNIQITPSGQVKVLDFGIARASFDAREAKTTTHIGGTPGYIAPERLEGLEGPEGDIFSLGVVLHKMVTGRRPKGKLLTDEPPTEPSGEEPLALEAMRYAFAMRNLDPEKRPTAREVERALSELRRQYGGISLRDWAEGHVPPTTDVAEDDLVGTIITESIETSPAISAPQSDPTWNTLVAPTTGSTPRRRGPGVILAAIAAMAVSGLLGVAAVAGLSTLFAGPATDSDTVADLVEDTDSPTDSPVPDPVDSDTDAEGPPDSDTDADGEGVAVADPPPIIRRPPKDPTPKRDPEPVVEPVGTVMVTGDGTVHLVGGDARHKVPGDVPPGRYEVEVAFGDRAPFVAGRLSVQQGKTVAINCVSRFAKCEW